MNVASQKEEEEEGSVTSDKGDEESSFKLDYLPRKTGN